MVKMNFTHKSLRSWLNSLAALCAFAILPSLAFGQITQQTATLNAGVDFGDGWFFYDSAGAPTLDANGCLIPAPYANGENSTLELCAEAGETITVSFIAFEVEASAFGTCFDVLTVAGATAGNGSYSGDDDDAGVGLGCADATDIDGNPVLGPFTSSAGGCLTFSFTSDGSVTLEGWAASIALSSGAVVAGGDTAPPTASVPSGALLHPVTGSATFTAGTDFVEGDMYTDSGDICGNYQNDEDGVVTICAAASEIVEIDFAAFEFELNFDELTIAGSTNGADGMYTGTDNPGMVRTPIGGCVTFTMDSDGSVTRPGWSATLSIITACTLPVDLGCISNLNVTLNAACQATITPDMVLTGVLPNCNLGVAITVDNTNSNVISGCGPHTYSVVITDAGNNNEVLYTCWGNINAEDKTPPTVVCPDAVSAVGATFQEQLFSGNLSAVDADLDMADYSCFTDFFNPTAGTHNYELITFTPDVTDVYTFVGQSDDFDVVLALFQGSFVEGNPCQNIVGQVAVTFTATFPSTLTNIFTDLGDVHRMSLPLVAGRTYVLMVSNSNDENLGDYTVRAYSDGTGVLSTFSAPAPVIFDIDLTCDDINQIRIPGQETYVVNAAGTTVAGSMSANLNRILNLTGFPTVRDNCGDVRVTVSDVVAAAGDCGDVVITRTFRVVDRINNCTNSAGNAGTAFCTQTITFRKLTIEDLVLPPYTAPIECDEQFATDGNVGGPDNNPDADVTGYPWVITAFGFRNLDDDYCNIGASYSDEPRINVCTSAYKFRRQWNIIDWCNPGDSFEWDQFIKVGDFTGPVQSGVNIPAIVSTSPFDCLSNFVVPTPTLTDNCSGGNVRPTTYTVYTGAGGTTYVSNGTYNLVGGVYRSTPIVRAPIGDHVIEICAVDACGNQTCIRYPFIVRDQIEPSASCDDQLNVSIGGGDVLNGVQGLSRLTANDIDEGSADNCGPVTLEVRRQILNPTTYECLLQFDYDGDGVVINDEVRRDPNDFAAPGGWFTPWLPFVDFTCCDVNVSVMVELRVTDGAGNTNVCWQNVIPEDKLNPFCYAPANVTLTCAALPLTFPGNLAHAYDIVGSGDTEPGTFAATSIMMDALFGAASGTDNCVVDTVVERTPTLNVNDCGWGTITRRFEAWQWRPAGDVNGNGIIDRAEAFVSLNSCAQTITITEIHDFVIDFPQDADANCGEACVWDIATVANGCDVFSVNRSEQRFSATGDECYKIGITYDVINWCLWDGEYTGYVIPRLTEDDGESLPVDRAVESTERPIVRASGTTAGTVAGVLDRTNASRTRCPLGGGNVAGDDSNLANTDLNAGNGGTRGRWIYTQFVKVYDNTAPEISVGEYGGPTDLCPTLEAREFGDVTGACTAPVTIPFNVTDPCELFNGAGEQVVTLISANLHAFAVDANRDGVIKANEFTPGASIMGNISGNATTGYTFSGTYPIITSAMGDNIFHAIRVVFRDGCGNTSSRIIEFKVLDCKGPAPVCINGLTVTLMPQLDGGCAMAIWASDFEGSFISDCTGQGPETFLGQPRVTKYAIYRWTTTQVAGFVPNPNDTGLVLTDEDDAPTIVRVYAFDEEGNYDYCETMVFVQAHPNCTNPDNGIVSGVIATEAGDNVEGVEVNVSGSMTASVVTLGNGAFEFSLPAGGDYSVAPYLNSNFLNGVSTFDLVLMSKHILGVQPLNSPYKLIAADVNNSGSVSTLDMIQLRKLILNIDTQFASNTSWRFIPAGYNFPVASNPWFTEFPEVANFNNFAASQVVSFVGVKVGDVNGSAQANALSGDDRTLNGQFNFNVANTSVKAGNVYTVAFTGADMASVEGFQATLALNGAELVDIEYGVATAENFGTRFAGEGMITTSWDGKATANDVLFSLVIRATVDAELSDVIGVSSRYTAAEAYANGNTMNVGVNFSNGQVAVAGFEVYQNTPNPFSAETVIGFNLPQDASAMVTISDASGRVLSTVRGDYAAGYNTVKLTKEMIQGATGVLTYTVTAGEFTATKKMIAVK